VSYQPSKYIVVSSTPISRAAAGLAVFATFREMTNDFEVWIEPDAPDDLVYVVNRSEFVKTDSMILQ